MRIRPQPEPKEWLVNAIAAPMFPMRLRQTGPFQAEVTTNIGDRIANPSYCFITVDESGLLPRVTQFSMHGTDAGSGKAISEYFRVSGGQFEF